MEAQAVDPYLQEFEEMKKRLKALEEENRDLQFQQTQNEEISGRQLLSSLRSFNANAELKKFVRDLLETNEKLQKALLSVSLQPNDIQFLEKEVSALKETVAEVQNKSWFSSASECWKSRKDAIANRMPKVTWYLGTAGAVGSLVASTITHSWNSLCHCLETSQVVGGLQGAVLVFLLLKFMSEEYRKLAVEELPTSSKIALRGLSNLINGMEPLANTADKLDQVLHKGFGMSLYSDEFRDLCLRNQNASSLENLKNFISTLSNEARRNVGEIMTDKSMEVPLEKLAEVVWNSNFLRCCALYQACKLIEVLPESYFSKCDDFVLNSVQFACNVIYGKHLDMKATANDIIKMRDDYKRITDFYLQNEKRIEK